MSWLDGSKNDHFTSFRCGRRGTLLIGACEKDGQLDAYRGMSPTEAGDVRDAYSKAIKDKCQPHPNVDFEEYPAPGDPAKRIVAVNVWASLLLVGVEIAAHKPAEGYGGPSFVYPVRSGTDATYLEPSQIAMYMTPHVRRVAVLLSRVPKGAIVYVKRPLHRPNHEVRARFEEVREEDNIVILHTLEMQPWRFHLDRITTVFEDAVGWQLYIELWNATPPDA